MGTSDELEAGRAACHRGAWDDGYQAPHRRRRRKSALSSEDLELLATAAYLTARDDEFHRVLERAHHAHLACKEAVRATRCAFWLGLISMFRGDSARGSGWLARAQRLVEGQDCAEQGYLLLPAAEQRLGEGNAQAANTIAARAAEMGDRFADPDLIACARHMQGRALIREHRVEAGLALLDEVMLAASSRELSPIMTGLIYCSVIDEYQKVCALGRARQWTAALMSWCDEQPQMLAFHGTCLVHRAEIMQLSGTWAEAMGEACRACERLALSPDRTLPAPAWYQQAELHRLRGQFAQAEEAYRRASRLGWEPQPGLALLRLAQGRTDAASAAISRVVATTTDPLRLARMLPVHIDILLTARDLAAARAACRQLEQIAEGFGTDMLRAMAAQARGAVALAEGEAQQALQPLRYAFEMWQKLNVPYEAARVRTRMALACRCLGDHEAAELELDAAREVFEKLGARPELDRLDALQQERDAGAGQEQRLSARELEVLRLVAAGKTNKAIAAQLFVSDRTIDRHVSNILNKLDLPSRAAAAAYAVSHQLI
jgi:DNA-binding CsgD family transcriptional regulator